MLMQLVEHKIMVDILEERLIQMIEQHIMLENLE
jgi:hypothetical protein